MTDPAHDLRHLRDFRARAADPFPTLVRTLDALHLATAIAVRQHRPDMAFATHDRDLALAAESMGLHLLD